MITASSEEKKVWGSVRHLFHSLYASVSLLKVKKGFRCSRHYHESRVNQFTSVSCIVAVQQWSQADAVYVETVLLPGETHIVDAGVIHRFCVLGNGELLEVYWPKEPGHFVKSDDIVRLDVGGADDRS